MSDNPAPRPVPVGEPSDADIERAIRTHATSDRAWALCWSVLKLADAIRETGRLRAK